MIQHVAPNGLCPAGNGRFAPIGDGRYVCLAAPGGRGDERMTTATW